MMIFYFFIVLLTIGCSSDDIKYQSSDISNKISDRERALLKQEIKDELLNELKQENEYSTDRRVERRYYHSGESGAIIVSQNGSPKFKWKKKCNSCGVTENSTRNENRRSGAISTMYNCHKCKHKSKVRVGSSSN